MKDPPVRRRTPSESENKMTDTDDCTVLPRSPYRRCPCAWCREEAARDAKGPFEWAAVHGKTHFCSRGCRDALAKYGTP